MSDEKVSAMLVLLVPTIIQEIVQNEKIQEDEAVNSFYASKLYAALENDQTKLWHLSPKALYELYKQENTTGRIDYPEEA